MSATCTDCGRVDCGAPVAQRALDEAMLSDGLPPFTIATLCADRDRALVDCLRAQLAAARAANGLAAERAAHAETRAECERHYEQVRAIERTADDAEAPGHDEDGPIDLAARVQWMRDRWTTERAAREQAERDWQAGHDGEPMPGGGEPSDWYARGVALAQVEGCVEAAAEERADDGRGEGCR